MRIAVLGAGAVGGYVGGFLTDAGYDVTLVDLWPAHIEAIRSNGLELSGPEGKTVAKPRILGIGEVSSLVRTDPIDIAFVSVKSYDTEWLTTLIKPYLAEDGCVVSLQNCLNEDVIARVIGPEHTLGCVVASISVELFEPGRIRRERERRTEGHNVFRVGELDGRMSARAAFIAEALGKVDNATVTTNLSGERWSKLASNAMNSGVAATTGLSAKQGMAEPELRAFMIDLATEAVTVGTALGHRLERVGKIDAQIFAKAGHGDTDARAEIDRLFGELADPRPAKRLSSMGQDVQKGRRTEIDFLNGYVVDKGREAGIPTPANARVVEIVRRVQRGVLSPQPANILGQPQPA
jgi:2-dehydropantoate 2-reductase